MSVNHSRTTIFKSQTKFAAAILSLIGTFVIGDIDYLTGYKISLLVFYILPVGFATIYVGPGFAAFLATLSIAISVSTDIWSGVPYSELSTISWNGTIALSLYFMVIGFLHFLNRILLGLESSVQEKTRDLLEEMSERGRLQREIIELSEREQRRFGQELHDVVCQELASVAIAAHMLERKLGEAGRNDQTHAHEIAQMADHALDSARQVARGFFTAGFDNMGLEEALRESARRTETVNRISCSVHWEENLAITDEDTVIHLFRIAQEGMQNAVKHAGASHLKVSLERRDHLLRLEIEDDGRGMSATSKSNQGLGLRIMAYRAARIGGQLTLERRAQGGTRVVCHVPFDDVKTLLPEMASR